jgi:outer membrane lipoprotein-sorting protein
MKHLKSLLITLTALLFVSLSAFTLQKEDQAAIKILNDVSKTYKSFKTIKANFKVQVKSKQDNSNISQSGVLYSKGKKFKIEMSGQEIYCDGKFLWTYLEDANEVQITKYDPNKEDISPSTIFTIYQKGFVSKYSGEDVAKGKTIQKIELTPKDKGKPYFKVKLSIEKTGHRINDMTVMNKNGMESRYEIVTLSPNLAMSDDLFKFDAKKKPGVVVVDLSK